MTVATGQGEPVRAPRASLYATPGSSAKTSDCPNRVDGPLAAFPMMHKTLRRLRGYHFTFSQRRPSPGAVPPGTGAEVIRWTCSRALQQPEIVSLGVRNAPRLLQKARWAGVFLQDTDEYVIFGSACVSAGSRGDFAPSTISGGTVDVWA